MTRLSSSFVRDRELLLIEAEVVGPIGRTAEARLVLDTGAAATTLTPRVIEKIGYTRRGAFKIEDPSGADQTMKVVAALIVCPARRCGVGRPK
jgi:predicted aspartyl protease